ncbi:spermidine synthase [Methylohalomonas lacus]|uniref:Spermidine synthase n=1 Tax=Methylohalomonas lacus TaxID=398773 RepID=A0AAE3HJF0_9GAMM|nr:spermidine synthase [Methylohalomonas lacus]MCS3903471.1 spermidine synthase [Methylohalomonas lacus]
MSLHFEELDYQETRLGELSLRRRRLPQTGELDIYEVKLGDEFLMSSLFTAAEEALARLGLAPLAGRALDVVVGGLGLGHTAAAALDAAHINELLVIEGLDAVIDWHERHLLPLGARLSGESRCRFIAGDFFQLAAADGFDPGQPGRRFDAILLDIDHAPGDLLNAGHADFYQPAGLRNLQRYLQADGVFALWSNEPPEAAFTQRLEQVFATVQAHVVEFDNPLQDSRSANTIYVAQRPLAA